ncbi:hypothetical protein CXB51_034227 [Gossypium anomalum]|uniref:Reverse transcriptase zinc-binding domain-containing protein n=1 Tax=Gossypium anomalum TaxID=47600 RepID=A0A8J5XX65_9ROSI|nr:hypothetical protein CXB51_034227 [Gossypium anomalum]
MLKLNELAAGSVQRIPISSKIASSRLWEDIRDKGSKVCWHRLFWFSLHIPKHSIVAWMADLNWLPTRDCLSSLGLNVDGRCLLCSRIAETRNHIFF